MVIAFFCDFIDENLDLFAYQRFVRFGGNFFLDVVDGVKACPREIFGNRFFFEFQGGSALFGTEDETAQVFEPNVLDELHQFIEIGIRFTGKADENRCAERYAGDFFPHRQEHFAQAFLRVVTPHQLENPVACMLDWHVDIFAKARFASHQIEQLVIDELRIPVEGTDPGNIRFLEDCF